MCVRTCSQAMATLERRGGTKRGDAWRLPARGRLRRVLRQRGGRLAQAMFSPPRPLAARSPCCRAPGRVWGYRSVGSGRSSEGARWSIHQEAALVASGWVEVPRGAASMARHHHSWGCRLPAGSGKRGGQGQQVRSLLKPGEPHGRLQGATNLRSRAWSKPSKPGGTARAEGAGEMALFSRRTAAFGELTGTGRARDVSMERDFGQPQERSSRTLDVSVGPPPRWLVRSADV